MEQPAFAGHPAYASVDEILARVNPPLSTSHAEYVRKAYCIAEEAHCDQLRKSGEPYFSHCVEVTSLLAGMVNDWPTLAAGLLHDTIEDCGFTKEHIRSLLPDPVAELVDGVTKISSIHFSSDREHQAGNLRKMILAMARDVRVVLIKLCDRLHNMRTLQYLELPKQKAIATSTTEIYAPLAKRLGMESICQELEDLSMSHLNPVLYRRLSEHLARNRTRYQSIMDRICAILDNALAEANIHAEITSRLKHIYSLYQKMVRNRLELTEIHDLIAIRIITPTVAETYEALGIVHSKWAPVEGRFKDYIATPKPNGYRSIHTTVIGVEGEWTEIQIRTREMHKIALEGVAAHWNYKEVGAESGPEKVEAEKLVWLRQLVDWLSDIQDPHEFMAAIKRDVFDASVFCYTPAGDVIEMPKGSCVLDFAYRIHTDVGHQCSGARVNHKMAPLRTELSTGDIVEVITAKTAHPTRDWVRTARTNRARNKIRHWLKTNDREFYLEKGRSDFFAALRLKHAQCSEPQIIKDLASIAKEMTLASADEIFVEVGFGSVKPGTVISKLDLPEPPPAPSKRLPRRVRKALPKGGILVEGMPGAITRMAGCCTPAEGDPIVGFVTQGRGVSIHRADCVSLARSREIHAESPSRVVEVEWSDSKAGHLKVTVRLTCQDRRGLLNDITQEISNGGIDITAANTQSNFRTGRAIMKVTVLPPDEQSLNDLLRRLETVPSVISISRVVHKR